MNTPDLHLYRCQICGHEFMSANDTMAIPCANRPNCTGWAMKIGEARR